MTRCLTLTVFCCATFFSCSARGQQALMFTSRSGQTAADGTRTITFSKLRPVMRAPITGAPYSADQVTENTQTLADGTHIKNSQHPLHMARDAQGRVRTELTVFGGMMGPSGQVDYPPVIEIYDPVAGVGYVLDDANKVAHHITVGAAAPRKIPAGMSAAGAMKLPNQPESSSENLGSQNIEGVEATGTRFTMTWPIGSQGNDRPLVETSETWYSQQLKVTVLSKYSSPRSGENTTRLTNISTVEPDPMLFQPPADYTVVDDKDSVVITVKPRPAAQ